MSGIAGWIGRGLDESPSDLLTSMLGALGGEGLRASAADWGMGTYSPFGLASVFEGDGLVVVLEGRVRFDDPTVANQAIEQSPAAAVASSYRRFGVDFLRGLKGSFALAVLEPISRTLLLAIDPFGIGRLTYAVKNNGVVFGSSVDAVTAHPAVPRNICRQSIFDYLYAHMVPAPGSIYEGVKKLLPAQYLLLRDSQVHFSFYREAEWEDGETNDFTSRAEELHHLLEVSVTTSLDSRPAAAFLSGGTDSSTVAGMLKRVRGEADTFTIGFEAEGFDEMDYARIAARHFGLRPHEYYVTPDDVVRAIPLIAAAYDEPFGNASAVPTYYCALKAKEAGIDVMLAGDGGDEIFGGNVRYAKQKVFEIYWKMPSFLRTGMIEPGLLSLPVLPGLAKVQSYVRQARVPLPDRLETYNFLHRDPLATIFTPDFLATVDPDQPLAIAREAYFRTRSEHPINRMLHLDWKQTLADNDLRKVCRMTELAGVEVRYPMLNEALVAFAAKLPPSYKVKGQQVRWFYKEALKGFLPHEIIHKSKQGFGLPFGLWMQRNPPLHRLAEDSLTSFRRRSILRDDYLDRLLAAHRTGHATYYGVMIWVIMMLEQWLQHHGSRD